MTCQGLRDPNEMSETAIENHFLKIFIKISVNFFITMGSELPFSGIIIIIYPLKCSAKIVEYVGSMVRNV